jgi:hypothetical protein
MARITIGGGSICKVINLIILPYGEPVSREKKEDDQKIMDFPYSKV